MPETLEKAEDTVMKNVKTNCGTYSWDEERRAFLLGALVCARRLVGCRSAYLWLPALFDIVYQP